MTKTVIKTIAFTLVGVLVLAGVLFVCFLLFSPKTLGNVSRAMGNSSAAVCFYERQYNKTKGADDLTVLVFAIDEKKNPDKAEQYTDELIEKFDEYLLLDRCDFSTDADTNAAAAKEYFYAKSSVGALYNKGLTAAIEKAMTYIVSNGYTKSNALRIIISTEGDNLTAENLVELKAALITAKTYSDSPLIDGDIAAIDKLLTEKN